MIDVKKLRSIEDTYDRIKFIKDSYKGKTAYIITPGPSLTTTGCCSETVIYPGSGLGISDPHSSKNVVSGITTSDDSNVSFI